jgi:hypothetical protein
VWDGYVNDFKVEGHEVVNCRMIITSRRDMMTMWWKVVKFVWSGERLGMIMKVG